MRNAIRSEHPVTEEELKRVKELDWESYYRESSPSDYQGMITCPECGIIVVARENGEKVSCYRCGREI